MKYPRPVKWFDVRIRTCIGDIVKTRGIITSTFYPHDRHTVSYCHHCGYQRSYSDGYCDSCGFFYQYVPPRREKKEKGTIRDTVNKGT